jgi:thiamine biosynthesis lipoprotein
MGIHNYLAEATGELKASGKKLDGSPWRIALEEPRDDQQVAERIVASTVSAFHVRRLP